LLKKVLKAVAKLQAKAGGAGPSDAGSSLTKKLRAAIANLETRAKDYYVTAELVRDAAQQLRLLLAVATSKLAAAKPGANAKLAMLPRTVNPSANPIPAMMAVPVKNAASTSTSATEVPTTPIANAKRLAKPAAKSKSEPTLADTIPDVLKFRQDQNAGAAKAWKLHSEAK
jgi:hypothetical protein